MMHVHRTPRLGATGCLAFLLFWACALNLGAQTNYVLSRTVIAGGGGVSTGGVFSVRGTVGQPAAWFTMTGGFYRLGCGFWGLVGTVLAPGAPTLQLSVTNNQVILAWPSTPKSWTLQQSMEMPATNWTDVVPGPADDNAQWRAVLAMPGGTRFYRLRKN